MSRRGETAANIRPRGGGDTGRSLRIRLVEGGASKRARARSGGCLKRCPGAGGYLGRAAAGRSRPLLRHPPSRSAKRRLPAKSAVALAVHGLANSLRAFRPVRATAYRTARSVEPIRLRVRGGCRPPVRRLAPRTRPPGVGRCPSPRARTRRLPLLAFTRAFSRQGPRARPGSSPGTAAGRASLARLAAQGGRFPGRRRG